MILMGRDHNGGVDWMRIGMGSILIMVELDG